MRKRIKPIIVLIFFACFLLLMGISKTSHDAALEKELKANQAKAAQEAKKAVAKATEKETTEPSETEAPFETKPIIDLSGWQLPSDIDYNALASGISGAIIRVYGGSQITQESNAAHTSGVDKAFKTHIKELQSRDVPVAVYSYALGGSVSEMKEEARLFYENASPYNPTFYWIDIEEHTMDNMDKGVEAFRSELEKLGAKNIGIYIGTYFMQEHEINVDKFDAVWIPTYGDNSGYYNAAPQTDLAYDLHQYTSKGWVPGYNGSVDLNQIAVTSEDAKATYEKLFGTIKED